MSGRVEVLIYVVHLLGSGHLHRAAALATALSNREISVCLVSGGRPIPLPHLSPDVRFEQLPSVRARDGDFSDLVDERDQPIDDNWRTDRVSRLLKIHRQTQASVLLIESYPFARRQMRFELQPLLQAADNQTLVSSIRDVLQPKSRADRIAETVDLVNSRFDHVLVHGDRQLAELSESFHALEKLTTPLHYTGYVDTVPASVSPGAVAQRFDVVVAAGGGAVGAGLYQTAIEAAGLAEQLSWLLLIGPNLSDSKLADLQTDAGPNLHIERNRSDYRELLSAARVSVSQAGYNTVVDLMGAGTVSGQRRTRANDKG